MPDKLILSENFSGMEFVNSPRITENEQTLRIEIVPINANAIAGFMFFVWLTMAVLLIWFDGSTRAIAFAVGGILPFSMLVGIFYFLAERDRNRVLPYVDKTQKQLVLVSGTAIAKEKIQCFKQYTCFTKMSQFRLVLTTVVGQDSEGTKEYAVIPIVGNLSEDRVGKRLAECFDTQLIQDNDRTFSVEELTAIGVI